MQFPAQLRYTADHEWVALDGNRVRIGVTDYAQDALGDVVYVGLPEVGTTLAAGDTFGEVESTKSVSDVYAPLAGTVSSVNEQLNDDSSLVNSDPYGDGWLCELEVGDDVDLSRLMTASEYQALVEG